MARYSTKTDTKGRSKSSTHSELLSVPPNLTTVPEQLAWVQAQLGLSNSVVRAHLVHNADGEVIGWCCILCSADFITLSENMYSQLEDHNISPEHLNRVAALHRVDRRTLGANLQRVCPEPRAPVPRLFSAAAFALDEVEREERRVLPPAITLQRLCGPGEVDVAALLYGDCVAGGAAADRLDLDITDTAYSPHMHTGLFAEKAARWEDLPELAASSPGDSDLDSSLPATPGEDVDISQDTLDKLFDEFIIMPQDDD